MNFDINLRDFPIHFRTLALGYLFALAFAYVYAFINIALVVGLTPSKVAEHYYGAPVLIKETEAVTSGDFSLDDLTDSEPVHQLSIKSLVAEGHYHLFGMSSFFFGLCLLGLFVKVPVKWKAFLVFIPFVTVVIDNLSFLATRYFGPSFAFLSMIAGSAMAVVFSILWILIFKELYIGWKK